MAETLSLTAVKALNGGGGGGGDVNVDNVTLQKENDILSFKVKSASDKEKVWKIKSDGTWDLSNINEWEAVSTFVGLVGNTYTLYILTQDITISDVKYRKGFYTWDSENGFVMRSGASEVFTDVGVNENLPTSDINANTIYRKANYEYLHDDNELEEEPVGYKIVDTENIRVSATGITIEGVETLWLDLTSSVVSELETNEKITSASFSEADFFNYDSTLYDIASNFERVIVYTLYHNPTATIGKYIQIGGGSSGEILIDNETIVKNGNNELEAKAIINVGTGSLPTTDIKDAIYQKTEVVTYEDEEEVSHTFSMVKFFVRKNNAWDSMSKIELTEEQYSHLTQAQKEDGTFYIFEGTPQATLTYATLPDKPTINGIVVYGNLTLADLSLYSRNEIDSLLANKGTAEFVNAVPNPTNPLTWYYSKKFIDGTDVPNDKRALYITDKNNTIYYMGIVGDIDLSAYYTKDQADAKFNEKITDDTDYTTPADTDKLANLTNTNKQVKRITFANLWAWILTKISGICEKGIQVSSGKIGHSNSITVPTGKRIIQGTYDAQGHLTAIQTEFNWSNNYVNSAENQLFTRKGANDMYVNYLKSTNGTLTKSSSITNDYSHYVKCGNIYQLSIGFQNSSDIAKDTTLYTLPETISNSSIEMYIVISTVDGNTRVLQCGGGGTGGNVLKAKSIIPAGYWFGSAIFIKL